MKILHLASEYPPAKVYGLGRFVHGLTRAQARAGDEVHVLTNSCGGAEDDQVVDGVRLHRIAFPNPPRPSDGHGEVLQWSHGAVSRLLDRRALLQGVDVVASHDWLAALAAREAASELAAPLVVTFHDEVVGKQLGLLGSEGRFVAELEALTALDATAVIANSAYVGEQLVRHYGVPREKLHAIPGGLDPAVVEVPRPELVPAFRRALVGEEELLVLFVGRLDPEKGLGVLSRAWPTVARALPEARLVIAGSGRLEPALAELLALPSVRHVGYVTGAALAHLYRAADVVVVPSVYEPFGLVALEAMAAGAAVLAARTGGLTEIVRHGQDGWTAARGDAEGLIEGLLQLGRDAALRQELGAAAARRTATDFSWDAIAARTRAVYEAVVGGPVRRSMDLTPPRPGLLALVHAPAGASAVELEESLRALQSVVDPPQEIRLVVTASLLAEAEDLSARYQRPECAVSAHMESERGPAAHALSSEAEHVLLLRAGVTPAETRREWLSGLAWLLDEAGAEGINPRLQDRASPTRAPALTLDHEPRRIASLDTRCVLGRRSWVGGQTDSFAALLSEWPCEQGWVHPVGVDLPGGCPVSVVLVAYQGCALTAQALEAVLAHTPPPYELLLVDNGSRDDTPALFEALRSTPPDRVQVQVLTNERNLGYPVAVNQAAAIARGHDLVLLNNDTRVRAGWLEGLLAAARDGESESPVGVVTAKVLNMDGTVQSAGGIQHYRDGSFEIPGQGEDRLAPPLNVPRELVNAGGPLMLLTRRLLDALAPGGRVFDEAFTPGYFEDSDLCYRASAAGFRLRYAPAAEVFHHGKATASLVAQEGEYDLWGERFQANQRRFLATWGSQLPERAPAEPRSVPRRRILLCYHRDPTTTAAYCERALRRDHEVVTAGRGQDLDLGEVSAETLLEAGGGRFDLLLAIEGETYLPLDLEAAPCPTALWAIDNHLHAREPGGRHFAWARRFDHVFVAQEEGVVALERVGVRARWLPLACDPELHGRSIAEAERDLPLVFVGNVRPFHRRRRALLDRLARHFPLVERQGVYGADMTRLLARARVAFNCSLAGDLNMRVFEAMAAGALVVTDAIANGQARLFASGEHLLAYQDQDLEQVVASALSDPAGARRIAERGQALVLRHHTYGPA